MGALAWGASRCVPSSTSAPPAGSAPPRTSAPSPSPAPPGVDAATARAGGDVDAAAEGGDAPSGPPGPRFLGRFDVRDDGTARFSWPGSAILVRFRGTQLSVVLDDHGWNHMDVRVDGTWRARLPLRKGKLEYTLASGLSEGEHTVRIARRNEGHGGVTTFHGFPVTGGEILAPPPAPQRRLEVLGDSITCGFGVDGRDPCPFEYWSENHERTYAAILGRALDAEEHTVAWSGFGMLRGADGSRTSTMQSLFGRTLATDFNLVWSFERYQPHAVLIALSTNDFAKGDPGPPFVAAYDAFLGRLRKVYPEALLVATTSPMLGGEQKDTSRRLIREAVASRSAAGDRKVDFFDFDSQKIADGFGCGHHPSAKVHEDMARKIEPYLREKLDWR